MSVLNSILAMQGRTKTLKQMYNSFKLLLCEPTKMPHAKWQLSSSCIILFICSLSFAAVEDNAWCRYESAYFELSTDLKAERALHLHNFLEQFRVAAQVALELQDEPPLERVQIIAFRRQRDFKTLTGTSKYIGFMQPSLTQSILVLGTSKPGALRNRVAAHEYVHYLMRKTSQDFHPMWYEEGMAGYLSTLKIGRKGIVLGEVPENMFNNIVGRDIDLEQLLSENSQSRWSQRKTRKFYEEAWLLVHYFRHGPHTQDQVNNFLQQINNGADNETAFRESFSTNIRNMEKALAVYARRIRPFQQSIAYTPPASTPQPDTRCLSPYEVRATLGRAMQVHNPDWAIKLLVKQLSHHPQDLSALTHLSEIYASTGDSDKAIRLAEATLDKYPNHPSSQIQLANMIVSTCLAKRSDVCFKKLKFAQNLYRKALRNTPERIDGVFGMGMTQLFMGRPGEAIKYFQVAYLRAPWAPILNFYLGETYREIGDELNARLYLSRANYWAIQPGIQQLSARAYALLQNKSRSGPPSL